MKINLPAIFSQNDPAWKNTRMGSMTIGEIGCLMTDVAMVLNLYGKRITPPQFLDQLNKNGGLSGNYFVWGVVNKLYPDIKLGNVVGGLVDPLTTNQMNTIRSKIDAGYPVIFQIDTMPATAQLDEHWVLAVDYDGDDFIVADPWDGAVKRITSWGVKPQYLIYAYAWYEGKASVVDSLISIAQSLYELLVKKATQWDKTVAKYVSDKDPKDALFEDLDRVVAGYKSQTTTAQTAQLEAEKQLAIARTEIKNQIEKLANIEKQCQNDYNLLLAQYNTLKDTVPNVEKLRVQYEGMISALQDELREAQKAKGIAELKVSELQTTVEALEKSQAKSYKLGELLKMIWLKVSTLDMKF